MLRKRVTTRHLRGDGDQVLDAHELAKPRPPSPGVTPGASAVSAARRGAVVESSQSRNSPTVRCAIGAKAARVVRVDDKPRDLVGLVGDERLVQERLQGQIGERQLRRQPLHAVCGGDARELIARACGRWPWRAGSSGRRRSACPVDDRAIGHGRLLGVRPNAAGHRALASRLRRGRPCRPPPVRR